MNDILYATQQAVAEAVPRRAEIVGVACGSGALDHGCADGPEMLRTLGFFRDLQDTDVRLRWDQTIRAPAPAGDALPAVAGVAGTLARSVARILADGGFPIVIGGDHSCAIGTWSGVHAHLAGAGHLGLIWIDAHMDSHTFTSSASQTIHGMPLACLLGYGDAALTQVMFDCPKVLPRDVCLIGVRSFEPGEAALLRTLGVRIYFMDEVEKRGLPEVFREAVALVTRHTAGYGITIDMDALDPAEAAGVGSPVPGGLHLTELLAAFESVHSDPNLLALEIAEYNPHRDNNDETALAVRELCMALLG